MHDQIFLSLILLDHANLSVEELGHSFFKECPNSAPS